MRFHNVVDGRAGKKILLAQAQNFAIHVVVVRVQHLGDKLGIGVFGNGAAILARVEAAHVEIGRFGAPQAQLRDACAVVPGHEHIAGHSQHAGIIFVLHIVVRTVPALFNLAVKAHFHSLVGVAFQPNAAAGQPVVGVLFLPAVHNLLLENAVFVQNGIPHAGNIVGCHAVQIAGRQAPKPAVAKAGVRLLLIDIIQLDAVVFQHGFGHIGKAHVEQAGFQAAAHQKFHAQVIHLLAVGAVGAGHEALALCAEHAAHNKRQRAVDLLIRGAGKVCGKFAEQLVGQQFVKLFLGHFRIQKPSTPFLSAR